MKTENILFLISGIFAALTIAIFWNNYLMLFFGGFAAFFFAACGYYEKNNL